MRRKETALAQMITCFFLLFLLVAIFKSKLESITKRNGELWDIQMANCPLTSAE